MEDIHAVSCQDFNDAAAQTRALLKDCVGNAVRACLVNGSIREGYVYAVDPENGSAAMLIKVHNAEANRCMTKSSESMRLLFPCQHDK